MEPGDGEEPSWAPWGPWGPGDVFVASLVARTATCLCAPLASRFYRFLARFSGRRRSLWRRAVGGSGAGGGAGAGATSRAFVGAPAAPRPLAPPPLATLVLVASTVLGIAEACSSRSTPKPRPPSPTARPNITFHTYACPPAYATWYCLNGATCFTVNIGESLLYNCECADGYMGQRCEFKDLDGSYLPSRQRVMLETASVAGGATIAVFLVVIVCIAVYIHFQRKLKESRATLYSVTEKLKKAQRSDRNSGMLMTAEKMRKEQTNEFKLFPQNGQVWCVDGNSCDLEKRPFNRNPMDFSVRRPQNSQYQNSPDIPSPPVVEPDPQFIRVGNPPSSTHRHLPSQQ